MDVRPFARRRRNRHGRGLRGSVLPKSMPGAKTPSDRFKGFAKHSADRLQALWGEALDSTDFCVEEISHNPEDFLPAPYHVPGSRLHHCGSTLRIVVYRRVLEQRAQAFDHLFDAIHTEHIEQVAKILAVSPSAVDPDFPLIEE